MSFNGRATYDNPTVMAPSVANAISMYARTETPFLDFIGDNDERGTSVKFGWVEDALIPNFDVMNDSGGISNADTSMTVSNGGRFNPFDLIMIDTEVMLVTAVAGNVLTITRGYGGTTAASHADVSTITKIASGNEEGGDATAPKTRSRVLIENVMHIIEPAPSKISDAEAEAAKYGGVQELTHQIDGMMKQALIDLELACQLSVQHGSTPLGTDNVPRTMKGLRWWPTTNVVDASTTNLTEAYFSARLVDFYRNGGKGIDFCLAPAVQKRKIDTFKLAATRWDGGDTGMKVQVTEYFHSFSTKPMRIILTPWLRQDELLFGDSDNIKVVPFIPFKKKPLAEAGFYSVMAVHGEYTLKVRHAAECTGLIKNLSTSL